jgi:hypothetical protein
LKHIKRRDLLQTLGFAVGSGSLAASPAQEQKRRGTSVPTPSRGAGRKANTEPEPKGRYVNRPLTQIDPRALRLLDEMEERAAHFFYEKADPRTGMVYDRARASGKGQPSGGVSRVFPNASSIAATGFGLSALCIAAERHYLKPSDCEERVRAILKFFAEECPHEHGFYYHYLDITNGARIGGLELSSIDTALLLCGILHCRQYFNSAELEKYAATIYERIDWPWMMAGGATLSMGWTPEDGFIKARWDMYAELLTMYLMAIGSPTFSIPAKVWNEVKRPLMEFGGIRYITGLAPLFIHQYPQAWCDYRDVRDEHANYFTNSVAATRGHQVFCMLLHGEFPAIDENLWGISASESRWGYRAWGGPPRLGPLDGTVVPCAAGGSLPFLPAECSNVLLTMRERYPKCWQRYGFVDAFQPSSGWYCDDVIAIDVGIMMLMAENLRSGMVWTDFMKNKEIHIAMKAVGFKRDPEANMQQI